MELLIIIVISCLFAVLFLLLWLRERSKTAQAEIVAYGLRSADANEENTRTNISDLEVKHPQALARLEQLGQIRQDNWGHWVWIDSGKRLDGND